MVVDCMLRDAAICGDEKRFRRLVCDGEDANAVIGALILGASSLDELDACRARSSAPGRLSILSFLLENHCLSLYTLNAPHSSLKGLTPLGMVTYLNRLDFVTVLLEKGDGLVLVDGVDSQRATPIMYAARDGHSDVLQYLIRQGARINSVDCFHHSVLFYATSAAQSLWTCELNLRVQRAQSLYSHGKKRNLKLALQENVDEYNSLSWLYQRHSSYPLSSPALRSCLRRLVTSITSSDLSAIHCLLFPTHDPQSSTPPPVPVLVNLPDENGWSPIHYCVTSPRPCSEILDTLYLAGADLSLYTADNTMTPLHALARFGGTGGTPSFCLYAFIVHLVRDLGAPLDAIDLNGETCIHVAARHGRCADILMAFLECDGDGAVAKIRNNDGQTACEIAKPEFCTIFEQDDGSMRPGSAASLRTIKPSYSASSLATSCSSTSSKTSGSFEDDIAQEQFPRPTSREKDNLRSTLVDTSDAQRLLDNLEFVSEQLRKSQVEKSYGGYIPIIEKGKARQSVDLDNAKDFLQHSRQTGSELLERFRQLTDSEVDDLHVAQDVYTSLEQLISRLEERAFADYEEEHAHTPMLSSYRRSSATPSLVNSGSTASLTSLADLAALITPTGSPRTSMGFLNTPRNDTNQEGKIVHEELELDFASALAAGGVTRQRRPSALSAIFALGTEVPVAPFSGLNFPIETGVNLVSIPPTRAPEVHATAVMEPQTQEPSPGVRAKRESWLDPYVRRANSDILKAHLANLLEIEQMLFGTEDLEREEVPSPGAVSDESDDISWRESVDALQQEEDGNFLDMFAGDDEEGSGQDMHPLDLLVSSERETDEDADCCSTRAATLKPVHRLSNGRSFSVLDILRIARRELYAVEESMLTACRSIEAVQRYISQAERLTSDIFQKMEHAVQAAHLSASLINLCAGDVPVEQGRSRSDSSASSVRHGPTPYSSPVAQRRSAIRITDVAVMNAESHAFPLPPPSSRGLQMSDHRPSVQSLASVASPSPKQVSPMSNDDFRALRRLLVRKIPVWLDATAYDVDKAGMWVGVVQAVVQNVQRTRL